MSTEIRLRRRPEGLPALDDFEIVEVPITAPGAGEIIVRTTFVSVDPGQRSRMRDADYVIGAAVGGSSLGVVVDSASPRVEVGALARGRWGWREHATVAADDVTVIERQDDIELTAELGVLGVPGLTAYVGFFDVGRPRPDDVVFVSGAAGAIGSMVGQMAKLHGCTVIGSAGSDHKVRFVEDLGFDAGFNHRDRPPAEALAELAPEGIDLYFDNVGGDHLQAAIMSMRHHGTIVCCGSVSAYNDDGPGPSITGLRRFVTARLRMEGFVIWDHWHRAEQHRADTLRWLRAGSLRDPVTVTEGFENTPAAFISMLQGGNVGKALVRVDT